MFKLNLKNLPTMVIAAIASLCICLAISTIRSDASTPSPILENQREPIILAANYSENDINSIARAVTVFVGRQIENRQKLEQRAAEGAEFRDAGSGVIVARRNATYYVLTNEHVVRDRNNYSIRTHDGDLHQVENMLPPYLDLGQQDTTKDTVTHFGKYNHQKKTVDGYDLALISFQSNNNYPVAVVGDANTTTVGTPVFVSGWPLPSNPSQDRTRVLRAGELQQILDPADPNGNYNLCYTAETARGMSGGPVFNDRGEVIGVHGEGKDNQRPQCFDVRLGIKINDFIDAQEQKGQYRLKNDLRFPPANPSEFASAVTYPNADTLRGVDYQQFFEISPNDPAYKAIQFVSQYGCMGAFQDGTFRPRRVATRGEFVVDINRCMNGLKEVASKSLPGGGISLENFDFLQQSVDELQREVESLSNNNNLLW